MDGGLNALMHISDSMDRDTIDWIDLPGVPMTLCMFWVVLVVFLLFDLILLLLDSLVLVLFLRGPIDSAKTTFVRIIEDKDFIGEESRGGGGGGGGRLGGEWLISGEYCSFDDSHEVEE